MKKTLLFVGIILLLSGCFGYDFKKQAIFTRSAPAPIGPYNQAVSFGGLVFVSGQIGIEPSTGTLSPDIELQFRQVMENIRNILLASQSSLENVLKVTIYLTDMNDFSLINQIYSEYFKDNFPARETVEVSKLPKNAKIEISVIAAKIRK